MTGHGLDGFPMKRLVLPILILVGVAVSFRSVAVRLSAFPPAAEPSLRDRAMRLEMLVGAAVDPSRFSEPAYAATLAREFNMVEPENAMKWRATEPARGQFVFGPGDQVVAFAEAHQMQVRGHNLLWYEHNPAWLEQGHWTPPELREAMRNHILQVAGHYSGKVFAWDVVNEAFDQHGELRHSIWYDQPGIGLAGQGTAYIEQAFHWAHEADPKALLFYNDYAAEGINPKSDAIYAMLKDFRLRGVPLDGVGLQMHLSLAGNTVSGLRASLSTLEANIDRLGRLGLKVQITEMDVGLPVGAGGQASDAAALEQQAEIYGLVAELCARRAVCTAFQTWGSTDRYSWIPGFTHGKQGAALLFDAAYRPKPAYDAVLKAFEDAKPAQMRSH
jgi:endo-1,4-beta-xylanase